MASDLRQTLEPVVQYFTRNAWPRDSPPGIVAMNRLINVFMSHNVKPQGLFDYSPFGSARWAEDPDDYRLAYCNWIHKLAQVIKADEDERAMLDAAHDIERAITIGFGPFFDEDDLRRMKISPDKIRNYTNIKKEFEQMREILEKVVH